MFALTYRIEKFKSSGINPGKLQSPLIGKISRGDTEDVSPAAEALQGTTYVFSHFKVRCRRVILPPKSIKNASKTE